MGYSFPWIILCAGTGVIIKSTGNMIDVVITDDINGAFKFIPWAFDLKPLDDS